MAYGIGLDIGIASVGFATVALNEQDEPCGILQIGSRIFDKAEEPMGDSLASARREARGMRRRLRRHRHRLERIRSLLVENGFISEKELSTLFDGRLSCIYELRVKALDERVLDAELCRILIHLAQRRGFKSNRKTDQSDKEGGLLLKAIEGNRLRMQEKGYRTAGEMFLLDPIYAEQKRNKGENYLATIQRDMVQEEASLILEKQQEFGNEKITKAFLDRYLEILLGQRSFDQGPGGDSPYGGNQIEKMIGVCTFEKETREPRAAKASYSFEYFELLQKVNHIRVSQGQQYYPLTEEQRKQVVALAHRTTDLTYDKLRKELSLPEDQFFNNVNYKTDVQEDEKKTKFSCMKAYHEMRKALNKVSKDRILELSKEQRNAIGYALSVYKTDGQIIEYLQNANLEPCDIEQILGMKGFRKFGHLSVKACDKLIPHLEQGKRYDEACTLAGYDFRAHGGQAKEFTLPANKEEMESITSPVVRRSISQTIKVMNALIRERGESPTFVHVELSRDMARSYDERVKVSKEMERNAKENELAMQALKEEFHINPTGQDLVKYRLYKEQNGICGYSLRIIRLERLFEPGYVEVDHIIPYSISFDDRMSNKILVFSEENRQKGNRLPLQYLKGERREAFLVYVETQVRNLKKRKNLLREVITEEDRKKWKDRSLQDAKTVSRFMYNYINDYLLFTPFRTEKKRHVVAVNGTITSYLRKRWGINKVREDGDLHHATDALVVACTTQGMIQRLSHHHESREAEYMQAEDAAYRVYKETGELLERFPYPWQHFRTEWLARIGEAPVETLQAAGIKDYRGLPLEQVRPIFVSRAPRHKVTGPAHKATTRAAAVLDNGKNIVVSKTALTDLKLGKDENGDVCIKGYYNRDSDRLLYEALLKRLVQYDGDAKQAFQEPFYKPKSDGTPGPLVKKVKVYDVCTLSVPVHNKTAVAENGDMIRIDVFHVENDGYYFVPIYVSDTVKERLPNRAAVAFKNYEDWKEMKEEDFLFSLYPSDLVYVEHKRSLTLQLVHKGSSKAKKQELSSALLYYVNAGTSVASIKVINHDHSYEISSLGIKTLKKLVKMQVDVLGNVYPVKKEKRQTFR